MRYFKTGGPGKENGTNKPSLKQEFGINIYILLYTKYMNNKDLLHSTEDYTQYFTIIVREII